MWVLIKLKYFICCWVELGGWFWGKLPCMLLTWGLRLITLTCMLLTWVWRLIFRLITSYVADLRFEVNYLVCCQLLKVWGELSCMLQTWDLRWIILYVADLRFEVKFFYMLLTLGLEVDYLVCCWLEVDIFSFVGQGALHSDKEGMVELFRLLLVAAIAVEYVCDVLMVTWVNKLIDRLSHQIHLKQTTLIKHLPCKQITQIL